MADPRFSVVIPTRERADTHAVTLATVIAQPFTDFEVIVCDNHSSPATAAVVDRAREKDARVRYVRADKPLAMSDNWELALSHASGEFVVYLGDDDALMPYALVEADRLLGRSDERILHSPSVLYTWPCLTSPESSNVLTLPVGRMQRRVSPRELIADVVGGSAPYTALPTIYRSAFLRRDLIEELRSRAGRVFGTSIPDVYTAFAFGLLVDSYLAVDVPMTVEGVSRHSNGFAAGNGGKDDPIWKEFDRLNHEAGLDAHPWIPAVTRTAWVVPDSFVKAAEHLDSREFLALLDRRSLIQKILAEMTESDPAARQRAFQRIRKSLADDADLMRWFNGLQPETIPVGTTSRFSPTPGLHGDRWCLWVGRFGVNDVAEAAQLAAELLGYRAGAIHYNSFSAPFNSGSDGVARPDAEILRLHRELTKLKTEIGKLSATPRTTTSLPARIVRRLLAATGLRAA